MTMKFLTLILILFWHDSYAGVIGELFTSPGQPAAGNQFLVDYEWTVHGCYTDFILNSNGAEHAFTVEGDVIRMYARIGEGWCWSPYIPYQENKEFTMDGHAEGLYTLQLYLVAGESNRPLPGPGDFSSLVAETQIRVGPAPQAVDFWSKTSAATLILLFLLVTFRSQKSKMHWHRSSNI